jgi:hypothetical protein
MTTLSMKHITKLILLLIGFLPAATVFSQTKPDTVKSSKPVFTASLGPYTGGKALASDVKKLVGLNPIVKVKDAKGTEYKVIAYEITWKKKELSDDVNTGKPKQVFYLVGTDVKNNQLPEDWRSDIGAGVKTGEEITLASILFFDPKKKVNYKATNNIVLSIL